MEYSIAARYGVIISAPRSGIILAIDDAIIWNFRGMFGRDSLDFALKFIEKWCNLIGVTLADYFLTKSDGTPLSCTMDVSWIFRTGYLR